MNRRNAGRKQPLWLTVIFCGAVGVFGLLCTRISHGEPMADARLASAPAVTSPAETAVPTPAPTEEPAEEALARGYFIEPAEGVLTSGYGARWGRSHDGIDIGADIGTEVYAADGGMVTYAAVCGGYGNYIKIDHQNGYQTAYAHLDEILVENGERVTQGQCIGKVGNTGNSTGPHLHFEVKTAEGFRDPLGYVAY